MTSWIIQTEGTKSGSLVQGSLVCACGVCVRVGCVCVLMCTHRCSCVCMCMPVCACAQVCMMCSHAGAHVCVCMCAFQLVPRTGVGSAVQQPIYCIHHPEKACLCLHLQARLRKTVFTWMSLLAVVQNCGTWSANTANVLWHVSHVTLMSFTSPELGNCNWTLTLDKYRCLPPNTSHPMAMSACGGYLMRWYSPLWNLSCGVSSLSVSGCGSSHWQLYVSTYRHQRHPIFVVCNYNTLKCSYRIVPKGHLFWEKYKVKHIRRWMNILLLRCDIYVTIVIYADIF